YEQTVLAAFADVNNALIATRTLAEEYDKTKIQVDAGRKALELTNAKYNYSYTSYLDVLIQENNVFAAELQESALKQQSLSAIVNLYKAL
ncbi:TolC family protein, partial [Acinetobacter baumannii]